MSNKRICVQIDFQGPSPFIINSNGTFDKRTSLVNLARLIRGIDQGAQYRKPSTPTTVVVQQTLVQASATATPASVVLNNTITIGGTALTAKKGRASSTCTCATAIAGNTLVVNGVTFTGAAGAAVPGEATFSIDTGDTETATSIAAQINAYVDPRIAGVVAARSAAAVVTIYAQAVGTGGNAYTLTSSGATLTVTGSGFLAGGAAMTNNQFDFNGTDITTGVDLARAINASTSAAVKQVNATVSTSTGVVTITAKTPGVAGNAITLTSVGGTITVTGSGFLANGSAGAPTQWSF